MHQLQELVQVEIPVPLQYPSLLKAKQWGLSDEKIAAKTNLYVDHIFQKRKEWNIQPTYKLVDSCSAEFEAYTPYYYSTFEQENESTVDQKPKVMILGSGANRIGQGIEFDYSCVQAAQCLSKMGYTSVMVNSNPETVSTDYDTSDKLYFEPLSFEEVYAIYEKEQPEGLILQLSGQTPFQLLDQLARAGVPILGTPARSIDLAEDREQFSKLLSQLGLIKANMAVLKMRKKPGKQLKELDFLSCCVPPL